MFIDEEEAQRRLRTEENLLTRLPEDQRPLPDEVSPVPNFSIEDLLSISDPLTSQELPDIEKKSSELSQNRLRRLLNVDPTYAGRGTKGLHRDTQASIGIAAGILGTSKASRLGEVARSQAVSYMHGYTGPVDNYNPDKSPKQELQNKIIEGHSIVVDKAFGRLLKTLDLLDDDKLTKVQKATDLSHIARNLSGIIGHAASATQDHVDVQEKSVHFHIMRPEQAKDADYQTIEVNTEKTELAWREKQL